MFLAFTTIIVPRNKTKFNTCVYNCFFKSLNGYISNRNITAIELQTVIFVQYSVRRYNICAAVNVSVANIIMTVCLLHEHLDWKNIVVNAFTNANIQTRLKYWYYQLHIIHITSFNGYLSKITTDRFEYTYQHCPYNTYCNGRER